MLTWDKYADTECANLAVRILEPGSERITDPQDALSNVGRLFHTQFQ